jgi:hypothetical protein
VRAVSHIVLKHHFDHILGPSAFKRAEIHCAPQVAVTMAERTDHLRADAFRYGADAGEANRAIATLRVPEQQVSSVVIDRGDCTSPSAIRSMRRSSADSRRGCASICDEFQSPNVT